ncbi:MAG: glycosyltransferase family 2 protein, partial [Thaumarchaeota archaeon]|nr:glycosyltransferase family 2 protein [Nitrososphaerota archaeon]
MAFGLAFILFLSLLVVAVFRIFSLWFFSVAYSFQKREHALPTDRMSVIVPAFNEEKTLDASLSSLLSQDHPDFEVVLVDDGSTDKTGSIALRHQGPNLKVVSQANRGKAEALNAGVGVSTGGIILTV